MSRKYLQAAKCSQMSSPKTGTGSGGDRCTAAVAAMIDVTYALGPKAKAAKTEDAITQIMYDLVDWLNPGHTTLPLENFQVWFPRWLARYGYDKIISLSNMHNPSFANVKEVIDRQQVAVIFVTDYSQLKTFDGGNPFAWNPAGQHVGHVLLLVGYDDNFQGHWGQTVIVHDPLRGTNGQPWDYSFKSIQASGFADLTEIVGAKLVYQENSDTQAPPPPDPAQELAILQAKVAAYEAWLKTMPPI